MSVLVLLTVAATVIAGPAVNPATPGCCNGTMCPMHKPSPDPGCDMDMGHPQRAFQSCPDYGIRYIASLTFVCAAPLVYFGEPAIEAAPIFAPAHAPEVVPSIDSPPPRASAS